MKFSQIDAIRVYREYCEENGWAFAPAPQALYCVAETAVEAERVVVARSLARNWEHAARRWWAKLEDAMGVLSALSSYLGAGLGEDTTTPDQYNERIRWGIDHLLRVETGRREEAERELKGAREDAAMMRLLLTEMQLCADCGRCAKRDRCNAAKEIDKMDRAAALKEDKDKGKESQ